MSLSSPTEICMVVWPASRTEQILGPNDSIAWVIGWNDRSLYIIVAWFLRNCTLQEAELELQKIRGTLHNDYGYLTEMPYRRLNILGCVRPNATLPSFNPHAINDAEDIRRARKDSYLWLELLEGPVLAELWCCGARVQPCQLHVVRCDPSKVLSTRPCIFSATTLYGVSGVRQLQRGIAPVCAPNAASNLEGVLLPPVMRKEAEPRVMLRQPSRRHISTMLNDSIVLAAEDNFLLSDRESDWRRGGPAGPTTASPSRSGFLTTAAPASGSFAKDESYTTDQSSHTQQPRHHRHEDSATAAPDGSISFSDGETSWAENGLRNTSPALHSDSEMEQFNSSNRRVEPPLLSPAPATAAAPAQPPAPPPAGVPPRLDFPSTTDRAEMSVLLATMRAGRNVRRIIQKEHASRQEEDLKDDAVEPLSGPLKYVVDFLFCYVIGFLKLWRFSKTAEVLLYRVAEFTHFLCALSGANHSCGLHPVLPHQVSSATSSVSRRYWCILSYLSRCAVDLALGVLVYLCVSAWGPPLYEASQYVSRHWLYEVHAAYMDWFDGYPAGLKVNEDLNMALCFFAKTVLEAWDALLSWVPATLPTLLSLSLASSVRSSSSMYLVNGIPTDVVHVSANETLTAAAPWSAHSNESARVLYEWVGTAFHLRIFCLLGCSTAAAFVSDLTGLVSLHLRFLYHAIALPYRFARVLLSNLFRQFYGVKYNPLRKRYDGCHFETDQMLAATFLFVILVFLFPTLAVYYLYFAFVLITIWAMETSLEAIAYLALNVPVFPVVYWLCERSQLSGGVALSDPVITSVRRFLGRGVRPDREAEELASHTVEVTVEALPLPLSSVLTDFFVVLDIIVGRLKPVKVVALVVRGRMEETPKMTDLIGPHLLTDCVSPRCTLCVPSSESVAAKKKK